MADFIQQLKIGSQVYDLYDSEFIVDTRTAAGASLTGLTKSSALFDGMQITFWLAYASAANATLTLTFPDTTTTGAIPCYYNGTTRLSTHYPAGSIIHFIYRTNVTIGSTTISAGWWSDAVGSVTYASSAGGLSAEIANARLPLRLQASSMTAQASANNTLSQGWWYIGSADSVKPPFKQVDGATGNDYRVMTTAYNDTWLQQIATDFRSNDVFIRRKQSGNWQPWTALVKMPQGATAAQLVPTTGSIAIFDSGRNATIKGSSASIDTNGALTATNITDSGLTASQAVSTDANKKLVSSDLTVNTATSGSTETDRFVSSVTQSAVGQITVTTQPVNDHMLVMTGTPTGDLAEDPISTTTAYTDYLAAVASHDKLVLDIPTESMSLELYPCVSDGSVLTTVLIFGSYVTTGVVISGENINNNTVEFTYWASTYSYAEFSSGADSAGTAYQANYADNFADSQNLSDGQYILEVFQYNNSIAKQWVALPSIPSAPVVGTLSLTTSWSGNGPYTQTVSISGSTANSKIDLQPNATVLTQMTTDGTTALYIENNNGTLTAYAVGAAPTVALSIQYTKTEVTTA